MTLTVKNTKNKKIRICDASGRDIKAVSSFDTKTCEIVFYPIYANFDKKMITVLTEFDSRGNRRLKKIKVIWKGAYAIVDGVRI